MESTLRNFWKMVHQEKVGLIVTLVEEIPGDCAEYFPSKSDANPVRTFGDMTVHV